MGIVWEFFRNSLGILWEFFGNSFGILWVWVGGDDVLLLCFKFVHEYLQKFRIWEDIRLKERQGQGQKRSLEARADAFSRLKRIIRC